MITKTTKPEKLIGWEEEFDEIGFGNQMRIPGGKYGAKRVELKSFLHSKLVAQQEKTEKMVLERVRMGVWDTNCKCCQVNLARLSKLSEMEEEK